MSPSNLAAYADRNARFAATDAETDVSEIPFIPFRQEYLITGVGPRMEAAAAVDLELGSDRRPATSVEGSPRRSSRKDLDRVCDLNKNKNPDADRFEVTIIHHTDCGSAPSADEELGRFFAAPGGYDEQTPSTHSNCAMTHAVRASSVDGLSEGSGRVCRHRLRRSPSGPRCHSRNYQPRNESSYAHPRNDKDGASILSPEPMRLGNQELELTQATSRPVRQVPPPPRSRLTTQTGISWWAAPNKTGPADTAGRLCSDLPDRATPTSS
jgi:carbonic anhydrase